MSGGEDTEKLFLSIGLAKQLSKTVLRNEELTARLQSVIEVAGVQGGCPKAKGVLLYAIASEYPEGAQEESRKWLAKKVSEGGLSKRSQLDAAFGYLAGAGAEAEEAELDKAAGVGVEVSAEEIAAVVGEFVAANKEALDKQRYRFNRGRLMGQAQRDERLKFVDGRFLKGTLWKVVDEYLGPRTAEDNAAAQGQKKSNKGKKQARGSSSSSQAASSSSSTAVTITRPTEVQYEKLKMRQMWLEGAKKWIGRKVELSGWIDTHRWGGKKVVFVELRDGSSNFGAFVQCVLAGPLVQNAEAQLLRRECTITVVGEMVAAGKTPRSCFDGVELQAEWWEMVGVSPVELDGIVTAESAEDVKFNQRHLVLRTAKPAIYMRLRSLFLLKVREHFFERGYSEVVPPTLVQTQCEGGATLFEFDFYQEKAYLTQSSQLYLETMLPSMGDVFCIAQSYRAEKFRTRRHVSEYTHLEGEAAFISFDQLLDAIEDLIVDTMERILATPYGDLMKQVNPDLKVPSRPFKRLSYVDALEFCREYKIHKEVDGKEVGLFEFGDDIPEKQERQVVELIGEPVFLTKFPVPIKSFYMPKDKDDPRVTLSADLLLPGVGEVVGGSMRIHDYDELMAAYEREGIDPTPYYWYTDQRKFGTCPHGGYGLGVERLLVWLFGDNHIKNVCTYPRYPGRCTP